MSWIRVRGEKVLQVRQDAAGPAHPQTLGTMVMLADLHRQAQHPERAVELLGQCQELASKSEPPLVAIVYQCEIVAGWCHAERRDYAAAEQCFLRCLLSFDAAERASANKGTLVRADPDLVALYRLTGKPDLAAKYESDHSRARDPDPSLQPAK